jgi:ATP-dependent exoDNAse (exonuclease V) beta subunit
MRREAPLLLEMAGEGRAAEDGAAEGAAPATPATMVEGVADLAFIEHRSGVAQWIVVDFKTDFELERRLSEYRIQLALYMRAIGRATSMPVAGYLLLI